MKRHPVLHKLSEDHHHGLLQCRHLKDVETAKVQGRVRAFLSAWRAEIAGHFIEEETALLPLVCPPVAADEPIIAEMLAQHIAIRRLVFELQTAQAADDRARCLELAHQIGALLEAHIRLEEHEVFELIQKTLDDGALVELGRRLTAWEAGAAGGTASD